MATDPSTVMFVTNAWKNVLKKNICADLIQDTMNAAFVWRWSISIYGANKRIRDPCAFCYVLCFQLLFIFFLLNFFLLLKKMVILKRYLLLNLLKAKGFGKISLNWDSFFTLFIGCLQWLSNFTLLSQGSQRLRNWNDTKWVVSTVDETSCIHWTPPGYPRVDHPIARYRWVGMLLSTKIT